MVAASLAIPVVGPLFWIGVSISSIITGSVTKNGLNAIREISDKEKYINAKVKAVKKEFEYIRIYLAI